MTSTDLEARLRQRVAEATEKLKVTFGYSPGRWLQMEAKLGTLEACHRILEGSDFVSQLTPMWRVGALHQSVEAIVAHEPEFAPLFSDHERGVARDRLSALDYKPGGEA